MAIESFLVTALPRTADPDRVVHVSLFVNHRLTPDGGEGVVADFPAVADWTSGLADATFELRVGGGGAMSVVPATPLLDRLEPTLWERVFPSDLPVRPWQVGDPAAEEWRTYPAHRMQNHALLAHAVSLFSSPVASPGVGANALTGFVMSALGLGQFERRMPLELLLGDELGDRGIDGMVTAFLDDLTQSGRVTPSAAAAQPLLGLTADTYRALRYYQRPEEQRPYRATPDPAATAVPVEKPEPDFHARVSLLGDLSPLLRKLGLVIDLHVDDVAALAGATELSASILVPGLDNPVGAQPRTACEVSGRAFWATSGSGDHHRGMVRLGDEERYRVLDLDPDASALKLEQYVRTVPRMLATEQNGDPVTSAPPTLRATGLAIARIDRAEALHSHLADAPARDAALAAGTAPPLSADDVTRGIRLEVWDDVSGVWHSLHRRRLDVEVEGAGLVLDDAADTGFLQGAALTRAEDPDGGTVAAPYHAHEVMAGWDGWSLSVPRPGKTVVHVDGDEMLVDAPDPDPDPVNPVASTTRIEPLTLPWLRYGRDYAFRAWTVDLAGNSAPHLVAGVPSDDLDEPGGGSSAPPVSDAVVEAARVAAEARLGSLSLDATGSTDERGAARSVRDDLRARHPVRDPGPRAGAGARGLDLTGFSPTGVTELDDLVRARVVRRVATAPVIGPVRRDRIEATFHRAAAEVPHLMERTDAKVAHDRLGSAVVTSIADHSGLTEMVPTLATELLDLVTTPRPFLRWDPVVEPVVVPRHPYTEAESQLTLVIRSGVAAAGGDDPYAVTVADPDAYSAQILADRPELGLLWRADSQRHLVPPKTSQFEAELHGRFDAAFGGGSEAEVRAALAAALREAGTLLDTTVADLADPGARLPQPGVELHTGPTAEVPAVTDPADLVRGAPLGTGQYVVHDTDQLVVPYLPDPLATKLSLTFPDAGQGHHLFGLWAIEGVTLPYAGDWPELRPWRLVLATGDELGAVTSSGAEGEVIRIHVPPGEQLRMNLSSALERDDLDLLGLWRLLPDVLRDVDVVAEAAADGWFWWLTPATPVRLVHAVPRPIEVPRTTVLIPVRFAGNTEVQLFGGVDLHGPSTERLDVEAEWSEWVDDIVKPAPERVTVKAAAAATTVRYHEDLVVLAGDQDVTVPMPDGSTLEVHAAVHQLGDTRHRDVDYRMRASTRYREYFDPRLVPTVDDVSVVGPPVPIDVPSTARPAKPVVHDVLPMFRWLEETEPEQPFGLRRTRRAGLRVYLERPWFSSGDGELLGLVLAMGNDSVTADHVSLWAGDPAFLQEGPDNRSILPLTDVAHLIGLDDRREGARPVGPPTPRTLVDVPGNPAVWVLGYEPEFSAERRMWFADVALDPGTAIWPFVRLAVTRFQPSSLAGLHLSPVVLCDFVSVPPERTATLTRPDPRHARVVVTGPVGVPNLGGGQVTTAPFGQWLIESRTMRVRLERRVTGVPGDLGWETVTTLDLPILGLDGTIVSWSGEVELPDALAPQRPGTSTTHRVTIEEWEHLPADPGPGDRRMGSQSRIVYADHLPL